MSGDGRSGAEDLPFRTDGGQGPEELTDLEGIGPARADKLRDAGFETLADVRAASQDDLADVLGPELAGRVRSQLGGVTAGETGEALDASEPASVDTGAEDSADTGPTVPSDTGAEDSADTGQDGDEDIGWESEGGGQPSGSGGGQEVEATVESGTDPTVETQQTGEGVETTVTRENGSSGESLVAAIVSFFLPGVGNMINGQVERGLIIFVGWIIWLIVGWGIGLVVIGSVVGLLTLGIGFILIGMVVGLIEFLIHVLAAVDAYRQSEIVDNVTVKVNEVRGN